MQNKTPTLFMPLTNLEYCDNMLGKKCSLYLHIPFCDKKCHFCSIKTTQHSDIDWDSYVNAMLHEIHKYRELLAYRRINCVHLGGGTPSLLHLRQIEKIISSVMKSTWYDSDTEIVFESHPGSLSHEKIDYLSQFQNVTLNMGVQTFHSDQLELINRPYVKKELINKLEFAKKRFDTFGIDLIAGLPNSSANSVYKDIQSAINLGIENISLYPLRVEKGSALYCKSKLKIPNEKGRIEILEAARCFLGESGYSASSIFHWTSGPNDSYQYSKNQIKGGEWVGIGAGAYTYLDQMVYLNHLSIQDYIASTQEKKIIHSSVEMQNVISRIVWELSFKIREGTLDLKDIHAQYGNILKSYLNRLIDLLCNLEYAFYHSEHLVTVTSKGIVCLDKIENIIKKVLS